MVSANQSNKTLRSGGTPNPATTYKPSEADLLAQQLIKDDDSVLSNRDICKVLTRMLLDGAEKTKMINQCMQKVTASESKVIASEAVN
jgi:hypothetical protein